MKTYSVVSDVLGITNIPNDIEDIDEAVQHVRHWYANCGKVRLVEHEWQCISQTPFMIDTEYRS